MEDLFNKITSNGCREMTETRFNEALSEYKQSILALVDEELFTVEDELTNSIILQPLTEPMFLCGKKEILTELKQKIEQL